MGFVRSLRGGVVLLAVAAALHLAAGTGSAQQDRAADRAPATAADTTPVRVPAPPPVRPGAEPPAPDPGAAPPRNGATAPDTTEANGAARSSAGDAASDSIFQALRRLPGFTAMEYRGDSATFRADQRVLRLFGSSEVVREGDKLTAEDTIVYREQTRLVEAYGKPTISGQAETIEGNVMFYDLATRRATVRGGRTRVAEGGASWFVRGDVTAEGTDRLYASRSIFTTDDRDEPAYYFEADNIKVIRDRILVGRPARLYFRNVPVFWLPFVAQDLSRGRRSGLLPVRFGINDIVRNQSTPQGARGTGRQIDNVGFYWAINDFMDAQLSTGWRSGDHTSLTGALQYRWNAQFLTGNLGYTQYWRDTGSREMRLTSSKSWRPDERTNMSLQANFMSTRFLREQIVVDYLGSTQNISSNFKLNRRFDWGTVDFGANRQQSMADDRVNMDLPQIGITLQPVTLFRETLPDRQRWYNNATINFGSIQASRNTLRYGDGVPAARRQSLRDVDRTRFQVGPSFSVGNFSISSGFGLNRTQYPEVPPLDTLPGYHAIGEDVGNWSAGISYRIGLVGETSVSPTLAFGQELRAGTFRNQAPGPPEIPLRPDELVDTEGRYVTSAMRTSFGASLNTALYGFLPGFGPFSTIRHKLTPTFSYSYQPQVQQTLEQERIFGRAGGRTRNLLSLGSLNQTFEAKMRGEGRPPSDPRTPDGSAPDTITGTGEAPGAQQAPAGDRKVTLLSINTSGFTYDFAPDTLGRRVGLTTMQVSNSITSDYMRGLTLSFAHDLFDRRAGIAAGGGPGGVGGIDGIGGPDGIGGIGGPGGIGGIGGTGGFGTSGQQRGPFRPYLSSVSTRFSLGQDSPFLRWLGLAGRVREAPASTDSIETQPLPSIPLDPAGRGAFTGNQQAVGGGPWRIDIGYTLQRSRGIGVAAHDLQLGTSFAPTPNWAVNWYTNYSIEDGSFGGHQFTLRRDLYRWEANFNFSRSVYGNTSFDVLIRLKDLPDLKVDYREHNIGANRR